MTQLKLEFEGTNAMHPIYTTPAEVIAAAKGSSLCLFKNPVGSWVMPYRMGAGVVWFRPLAGALRTGLRGERSA